MNKVDTMIDFKIEKAKESNWNSILELLRETGLTLWLTGKEVYSDYYMVVSPSTKSLIGCFSIVVEDNTGILKSFAISKKLQRKGCGKQIADQIPAICKELNLKKIYAISDIPNFWRKTFLKEINFDEIEDKCLHDFINTVKNRVPNYFDIAYFYMSKFN